MLKNSLKHIKQNLLIQGNFVVFGYGGLYQQPKGWGMDIAYINRSDFKGFGAKQKVLHKIEDRIKRYVDTGILTNLFMPNFIKKLHHESYTQWHLEKCKIMYDHFRNYAVTYTSLKDGW